MRQPRLDMEDHHTREMNDRADLRRYGPINVDEAREADLERTARYNAMMEKKEEEGDA